MKNNINQNVKPRQVVEETNDGVYIDSFKIEYVIEGSIKKETLSSEVEKVTLSFLVKKERSDNLAKSNF